MGRPFHLVWLCCVTIGLCVAADEPKVPDLKKPQWERMLKGEDAKKAEELTARTNEFEKRNYYASAIAAAEELLTLRTKVQGADHHETVTLKHNIVLLQKLADLSAEKRRSWRAALIGAKEATGLEDKGRYVEAFAKQQHRLKWCREVLGENHPDTATSYNNLAYNLDGQTKHAEAQPLYQQALEIRKKVLGEEHPGTATSYNNVASNLNAQGKYTEAQPLLVKALEIRRKVLGEKHFDTATSYDNLAYNLFVQAKHAEAQPLFQKVLELYRMALGEEHSDTAMRYSNLASNLSAQAKHAEAQSLHQKALEIGRRVLGEEHPDTANYSILMASNLRALAKYAEAQLLHQKALDVRRKVLGEEHPGTAASYDNLALCLSDQAKYAEAQLLHQKALDVRRKVLGEEHPSTAASYNGLASNLHYQGLHAEAQPLYQKALEIHRKVHGEEHPDTATSYSNVASNLGTQGKHAEAQLLFQKALEICRKALGEEHLRTATIYSGLASNLYDQAKYAEAQPHYRKVLEIRRKVLGEEHPDTATSYYNLAANLTAQAEYAEAQPLHQKALDVRRKVLGEEHPSTASSYNGLASNLTGRAKYTEAQSLYQKALDIRRKVLGEEHPDTATSYHNLASNLNVQAKHAEAEPVLERAIYSYEASRISGAAGLDRASIRKANPRLALALLRQGEHPAESWQLVELALARGLFDQQAIRHDPKLTPAERTERAELRERVARLQPQILFLATRPKRTKAESTELESLLDGRREAERRLAAIAITVSQREVANPEEIRKAIPPDAALLFWVDVATQNGDIQEHWVCVVRPTGEPKWERLPGTGVTGEWTWDDTYLPLTVRIALARSAPQSEMVVLTSRLRAQRIAPALKHLDGVKTLYVVPVSPMTGIPVDLLVPNTTVSYVPSGTYLARAKAQQPPKGQQLLALGDPLFLQPGEKRALPTKLPPGGLLITQVVPNSTAAKARLEAGDVILKYGNGEIKDLAGLSAAITANAKVESVPVTVWRESADKPFVRDVPSGQFGAMFAREPAPVAIANRRKTDAMLLALRGGEWKDLPGTRVETDTLKKMFGADCVALTDGAASEQSLDALRKSGELAKFRYLHFATHGEGNAVKAFESALILAQDKLPKDSLPKPGEPFINGQLSAREVLDFWKLDAELVTLSACETAVGKASSGDGSLGFAQAFLHAGARSVCLSLWKVDDTATALLMNRFYQNLLGKREGLKAPLGKAAALDEAKRWLRNLSGEEALALTAKLTDGVARGDRGKGVELKPVNPADPKLPPAKDSKPFAHPKFWAAFVLIGDPN